MHQFVISKIIILVISATLAFSSTTVANDIPKENNSSVTADKSSLGYSDTKHSKVEFVPYVKTTPRPTEKTTKKQQNKKQTNAAQTTSVQQKKQVKYEANCIYYNGSRVRLSYSGYGFNGYSERTLNHLQKKVNAGQAIVVGPSFSPNDGVPNYIMGHNPGVMRPIATMRVGARFIITDKNGKAYKYKVVQQGRGPYDALVLNANLSAADILYRGSGGEGVFIQFCVNGHHDTIILRAKQEK